jgi:cysteinyl-tRNA synthetase
MSTKYLGKTFDIHGGGMDLKFPHHECEIAQSKGCGDSDPANYWMHGNMLTVNGQKMSKSLGNGFSPEELKTGSHPILEKGYSEMTVRFFMLQSHYGSTLDFSNDALNASEKGFEKLMNAWDTLQNLKSSNDSSINISTLKQKCYDAMNDDFNTPILIAHLFEGVKIINTINDDKATISTIDLTELKELFNQFLFDVLGLKSEEKSSTNNDLTDSIMNVVLNLRKEAKENKDYALADSIRNNLAEINIIIKDSKEGAVWEVN